MVIDIIFAIVAGYGFYLGFSRGIIQTLFGILSILFGLLAAFRFGPFATNVLESTFNSNNPMMFIAGFLLAFVLTMVLIRMFARGIEGVLETTNINILNQAAGGILTAGGLILVYSTLLWFANASHILNEDAKKQSITYQYIDEFPTKVWALGKQLKPTFEDFWDHSIEFMDKLEDMSLERSESKTKIIDYDDEDERTN